LDRSGGEKKGGGEEKVNIEWELVSLSANVKRLHKLNMVFVTA